MVEKIVNLLQSKDEELRRLGLSYLNDNKKNSKLCVIWNTIVAKYIVSIYRNNIEAYSFESIYYILQSSSFNRLDKDILFPYVNYCTEIKNL